LLITIILSFKLSTNCLLHTAFVYWKFLLFQLLFDKEFENNPIEKIKVISSTYMAACGLLPGRSSSLETPCSFSEPFARSVSKIISVNLSLYPKKCQVSVNHLHGLLKKYFPICRKFTQNCFGFQWTRQRKRIQNFNPYVSSLLKVLGGGLNKFRGKEG
jgi:hypothetical protein